MDKRLVKAFTKLTSEEGEEFTPFLWQRRLLDTLLDGEIPPAVDIPTGLGKTSVMALWLLAKSEGANLPRRLVYVVDRRAVVDQATRFAEQLRRNMPLDLAGKLGLTDSKGTLPISTLRGGFADNKEWLEDPAKPAIVVGTIDMIGFRLLFSGYGVSRRMRPYHAGLLGADALVLLDEAHLCPPFEALLRHIETHRDGEFGPQAGCDPYVPAFRLMALSATGRNLGAIPTQSVFRLEARDYEESLVRQRLLAKKRLKVIELDGQPSLAESIANKAYKLGGGAKTCRVLVYCNSIKTALEVKKEIDEKCKQRQKAGELVSGYESELLVGERRIYERRVQENWLKSRGFLGGSKDSPKASTFLIATSAGEVGVDLDADHMVCDLVAYERMVQRLGRVNRRGGEARSAIVEVFAVSPPIPKANANKVEKEKHEKDFATYTKQLAPLRQLPRGKDGRHNANPSAMADLKRNHPAVVDEATTPVSLYPKLTRPLVDAWAMTSLKQHEGRPEAAPWLHGWEEEDEPQTTLVWRKHLPHVRRSSETSLPSFMATEFFRSVPIHATEKLEAPSGRVFDWLLKRTGQVGNRGGDHALAIQDDEIVAILLDRAGEYVAHASLSDIQHLAAPTKSLNKSEQRNRDRRKKEWKERLLPGALLVLDARIGGLRDGMLDEKSGDKVPVADADKHWREMKEDASAEQPRPLIGFRVEEVTSDEQGEGLVFPAELKDWRHVRTFETDFGAGGAMQRGLAVFKHPEYETDEDARSIASIPQKLAEHAERAEARAHDMATRLNLPKDEIEAITLAARLHDEGKATPRWQNAMNAPRNGRPFAKTRGGGNWRLLEGYRHEFGSLLKAESEDLPDSTRDLILHLIAAHHGYARPIISSAGCEDGPPSLLESKGGEAALRFARLQKRYGPWGLAWREAILRAVDQIVSRELSKTHGKQNDG